MNQSKIKSSDNCKWRLIRTNTGLNNRTFIIENVKYKEPLFADQSFFQRDQLNKRNIYTFNNETLIQEQMDETEWILDCSRGHIFVNQQD